MGKARFTEHQIIAVIKSVEAGRTVKDVYRGPAFLTQSQSGNRLRFMNAEKGSHTAALVSARRNKMARI